MLTITLKALIPKFNQSILTRSSFRFGSTASLSWTQTQPSRKTSRLAAFYQSKRRSTKSFKHKSSRLIDPPTSSRFEVVSVSGGNKQGGKRNVRLLKVNYIKEFRVLGKGEDPIDVSRCYVDLSSVVAREEAAVRQAEAEAERIGVGVTSEAQNLFDALSKTLPVRWDKSVIVVMNEVRVSSPYTPESVTGGTASANERVRKVLEFERKRMQTRGSGHF